MYDYTKHLIDSRSTIKEALVKINNLGLDTILFVVNKKGQLLGSLTDGDIRRGLLEKLNIDDKVNLFIQENPKFIKLDEYLIQEIIDLRSKNFKIIPILDKKNVIIDILNFRLTSSLLPIDVVVMAGGLGSRLKPMTDIIPKPLLKIGGKEIIDYSIDRLINFGVKNFHFCLRYMSNQIQEHVDKTFRENININYVFEDEPLGTIGAITKIKDFKNDYILLTNSDILTKLDYENFFKDFIENDADMSVVTIPYSVKVPYAVLETTNNHIVSFSEKPTYNYFSNGGIYLLKKEIISNIPLNTFYNTTDLMEKLIKNKYKLISFPLKEYWIDIGSKDEFDKAQNDIKSLNI